MALSVVEAHAATFLGEGFDAFSWTLTPPADAVGIVVLVTGAPDPLTYGGVSLSLVVAGGSSGQGIALYELLDLSGASGTDLAGTTGDGRHLLEAAWLCDDDVVERVDAEVTNYVDPDTLVTLTPDRAGCAAVVGGTAAAASGVGVAAIAPYTGQTGLSEADTTGGGGPIHAMNASWRGSISTPTAVGFTGSGSGWSGGTAAALYGPLPVAAVLARHGEATGFRGLTVAPSGPSMVYLARRPIERTGFRPLTVRASGPRQVALVGQHLGTSEMTDPPVGISVPVLRHRAAAKPAFEELATLVAEAGIGGDTSLLIDTSVSGATTVDRNDAATHDLTLTGNATLTPDHTAPTTGEAIDLRLLVRQDGTGGWTLAWGGTITWAGGAEPTMPTDPDTLLTVGLLSVDDAVTWLGYVADADAAGVPATTVTDETTWGITPAVGTDTEYARQDHTHGAPAEPAGGGTGPILISDTPSTPLVFADLIQNEAQDDLVYADT